MNTHRKTKLELIIEKADNHFWGWIEGKGFMPTGQGESIDALIQNIKDSIEDYIEHEGKEDKFWSKVNLAAIDFNLHYNLEAFFEEFDDVKTTSIARRAGLNESLVRQYATGKKTASIDQVKKIEAAIHDLASKLQKVSMYA